MPDEIAVFLGPTISVSEARTYLDARYFPPCSQGDLIRAVRSCSPSTIAIIDGAFASRPAVRHKEILWTISTGVRVIGASSMGAIRAAELNSQGMIGSGFVYRWYRYTTLAEDADVAVPMAPPELGSLALGDALIDVRLTLKKAERAGVIDRLCRIELERVARSVHYLQRSYRTVLSKAALSEIDIDIENITNWISQNFVNKKKDDAINLLKHLASLSDFYSCRDPKNKDFDLTDNFCA